MYIAYIVPVFLLGIAVGIEQIGNCAARAITLLLLLAVGFAGLYYQSTPNARDDFRSAARFVETFDDPDDIVLVMSNYAESTFGLLLSRPGGGNGSWMRVLQDTPSTRCNPYRKNTIHSGWFYVTPTSPTRKTGSMAGSGHSTRCERRLFPLARPSAPTIYVR